MRRCYRLAELPQVATVVSLMNSVSGDSAGAAVAAGDGGVVVAGLGVLAVGLVTLVDTPLVGAGSVLAGAVLSCPAGGALVHPASAPARRIPTAAGRVPMPQCHPSAGGAHRQLRCASQSSGTRPSGPGTGCVSGWLTGGASSGPFVIREVR